MIRTSKDQNVKNQNVKNQNVKNQNVKKIVESLKMTFNILIFFDTIGNIRTYIGTFSSQKYFWRSDFTYGVRKDQNIENWKDQLPMAGVLKLFCIATLSKYFWNYATLEFWIFVSGGTQVASWPPPSLTIKDWTCHHRVRSCNFATL